MATAMPEKPDREVLPGRLALPGRIVTGQGILKNLLVECSVFGSNGLIVHGGAAERAGLLESFVQPELAPVRTVFWKYGGGEPTLAQLEVLLAFARKQRVDWVAAIGGGSVIDIAKACAGLIDAPLPARAYHDGAEVPAGHIPFVAVPTTAGTGSEATFVCVFTNEKTGVKKSFRHHSFLARVVILDARVIESCPREVIAGPGMDALTQGIESFVSRGSTWITDAYALESIRLIADNLEKAFNGARGTAAHNLMVGSHFAGIALCNARLGLVHGLAHPLGAYYHQPHGLACAVCLPHVLEFNRPDIADKYEAMSLAVGADLTERVEQLNRCMGIRSPFKGKRMENRSVIIDETLASGSTAANPRRVTASDVDTILDKLF